MLAPKPIDIRDLRSVLELLDIESISCTAAEFFHREELRCSLNEQVQPLEHPCNSLTRLRFRASRLSHPRYAKY